MYSIIIVDDEIDVRKAIINIIQWDKLGFVLAGEAGNGQEALALIEETAPDVILTDIKMPFMDGITLAKRVREANPVTKIVFLTGFNDFDYAISAIKLNVIEYLLKPISAQSLTDTLISIRKKLEQEEQEVRDMERLKAAYGQSLELRKMSFLISMVTEGAGETNGEALRRQVREYRLSLMGERFQLFAISLDSASFQSATVATEDLELLKFSVAKTAEDIAAKYLDNEIFIFGANIICILSGTKDNIDAYGDILIREVHQSIPHYYGFTVTVGVGGVYEDLARTKEAFGAALSAIAYRVTLGDGKVIYLSDVEKGREYIPVYSDSRDMRLSSIVKTGNREELESFLDDVFGELRDHRSGPEIYRITMIGMYAVVLRALKSVSGGEELEWFGELSFGNELFLYDPASLRSWFTGLCHRVMDHIRQQQKTSANIVADRGYTYLREHYSDPELSLKSVSRKLHISASYFSSIFKKETGMSFTEALIKIRMETARELLLTTPDKIFEIAAKTGYADQHYFSYCFKKHFGQSPNETRAAHAAEPVT